MEKKRPFNKNNPELAKQRMLRIEREEAENLEQLKQNQVHISEKKSFGVINTTVDKEGNLILNSNEEPIKIKSLDNLPNITSTTNPPNITNMAKKEGLQKIDDFSKLGTLIDTSKSPDATTPVNPDTTASTSPDTTAKKVSKKVAAKKAAGIKPASTKVSKKAVVVATAPAVAVAAPAIPVIPAAVIAPVVPATPEPMISISKIADYKDPEAGDVLASQNIVKRINNYLKIKNPEAEYTIKRVIPTKDAGVSTYVIVGKETNSKGEFIVDRTIDSRALTGIIKEEIERSEREASASSKKIEYPNIFVYPGDFISMNGKKYEVISTENNIIKTREEGKKKSNTKSRLEFNEYLSKNKYSLIRKEDTVAAAAPIAPVTSATTGPATPAIATPATKVAAAPAVAVAPKTPASPVAKSLDTKSPEPVKSKEQIERDERFNAIVREIELMEKLGKIQKTDEEKIELWMKISEKYKLGITSIKPIEGPSKKELKEEAEREQTISNIGEELKKGINRVVVHGERNENLYNGKIYSNPDLDSESALYLLNDISNVKYDESIVNKRGPHSELVAKGTKSWNQKGRALYIDTGGERMRIVGDKNGVDMFLDHHQEGYGSETSATELLYETLRKNNLIKDEPWIENFVKFNTDIDNLQFVRKENFGLDYLKNEWPRSLHALVKPSNKNSENKLPLQEIIRLFKEGRDPANPYTQEEIKTKTFKINGVEVRLEDLIKERQQELITDFENIEFAKEKMIKNGIKSITAEFGKILYNNYSPEGKNGKSHTNTIHHSLISAKASGYDTLISYNANTNRIYINSDTYDLTNAYERIKKIVPEVKLVRGVMVISPFGKKNREEMTEDKLLSALNIKE